MGMAEKSVKYVHSVGRGKRMELSDRQRLAIPEIVKGAADEEAGKICGVKRQTVWEWRHNHAKFIRALNIERNKLSRRTMQLFREQMAAMTNAALGEISAAIRRGDTPTARWLLERIDIGTFAKKMFEREANPALFPEELEAILDEMADYRVDEFFRRKGIGPTERLCLQPTLKAKELESLKGEYRMGNDAKE